jgi:hypothetical protein
VAWRPQAPNWYAYLLGIYLGDGWLSLSPGKAAVLRVTLDADYPRVIEETKTAMRVMDETVVVGSFRRPRQRAVVLHSSHPVWRVAFPQHAAGRKHNRSIRLARWQRDLTHHHPQALIRGLIHSDGCRTINRFQVRLPSGRVAEYAYPRYFFSNLSADIRQIFCEHCELLGIRWTQSNPRNISISHRDSVALLDTFVGAKR